MARTSRRSVRKTYNRDQIVAIRAKRKQERDMKRKKALLARALVNAPVISRCIFDEELPRESDMHLFAEAPRRKKTNTNSIVEHSSGHSRNRDALVQYAQAQAAAHKHKISAIERRARVKMGGESAVKGSSIEPVNLQTSHHVKILVQNQENAINAAKNAAVQLQQATPLHDYNFRAFAPGSVISKETSRGRSRGSKAKTADSIDSRCVCVCVCVFM
jgi:hypothetical protein